MNAKIEKLSISVGGRTIDLTLEEAQALQVELNSKLGDTRFVPVTVIREVVPQVWPPVYVYPNTIQPSCPPYTITCGNGSQMDYFNGRATN